MSLVNVQVERPMVGSGLISSSRPSENDSRERPNTSLVKKTTPAALPSISGTLASNETKSWKEFAWGNNQVFERVETTVCSHLTVNSEARFSQPNRTYFSDTNNKQTSQSTRCDTDANTSYSQSNFEIQSTLPAITTSTNSQDDCSVPNSSNRFSPTNPNTNYDSSISRKTSTKSEQISQSTRCDIDANTSYSQSNFEIQPTVPPITTSTSIRDDCSVPNNFNPLSSENPTPLTTAPFLEKLLPRTNKPLNPPAVKLTLIHLTPNLTLKSSQQCHQPLLPQVFEMIAQSLTTLNYYHQKIPKRITTAPFLEKLLPRVNKPLNPSAVILTLIRLTPNQTLKSSQLCPQSLPPQAFEMIAQSQTTLIHYHQKIPTPLTTAPFLEKLLPRTNKPLNPPAVKLTLIHLTPNLTLKSSQQCHQPLLPQVFEMIAQSLTTLNYYHQKIPKRITTAPFLEKLLPRVNKPLKPPAVILMLIRLTPNQTLKSSQLCPQSLPPQAFETIAQSQTTLIHYHQKIPTPLTTAPFLEKLLPRTNKPLNPPAVILTLIHLTPNLTLKSSQQCRQSLLP